MLELMQLTVGVLKFLICSGTDYNSYEHRWHCTAPLCMSYFLESGKVYLHSATPFFIACTFFYITNAISLLGTSGQFTHNVYWSKMFNNCITSSAIFLKNRNSKQSPESTRINRPLLSDEDNIIWVFKCQLLRVNEGQIPYCVADTRWILLNQWPPR
jgi:hypothetical protein